MPRSTVPHQHPALLAWHQLGFGCREPSEIITLQEKKKAGIYEMHHAGPGGCTVVAKRSPLEKALVEKTIYEKVFPRLPGQSFAYYGFVESGDGAWLFIERANGVKYSPRLSEHRKLAAHWLAQLHLTGASMDLSVRLPAKSSEHYREQLCLAAQRIESGYSNSSLSKVEREMLTTWSRQLDDLQSHWDLLNKLFTETPQTVVHGDFAKKNILVHENEEELFVFDWGTAGWGPLIPDLPQNDENETYWVGPDLDSYRELTIGQWPQLDSQRLLVLAAAGKIVRALTALKGDANALRTPWAPHVMHKIPPYFVQISSGMDAVGMPHNRRLSLSHLESRQ